MQLGIGSFCNGMPSATRRGSRDDDVGNRKNSIVLLHATRPDETAQLHEQRQHPGSQALSSTKLRTDKLSCHLSNLRPSQRASTSHDSASTQAHRAGVDVVQPPGHDRLAKNERVRLEPRNVLLYGALKVAELEEVHGVNRGRAGPGDGRAHARTDVGRTAGRHAAAGVVEERDLARAEHLLRDDQTPERVFSVCNPACVSR
jgi:hypothetical protein